MEQITTAKTRRGSGLLYGITAYVMWGIFPIYFKLLAHVSPWVVLCHRIIWSALFLAVIVTVRKEWNCVWPALRRRRSVLLLGAGAILIAINWLVFIYAVGHGLTLQSSLGYFINPLLTIVLGMVFLRERLRPLQWVAVAVATAAVANLALRGGAFPWVALSLACSFGFYGLVRKKVDINSLHALLVESSLLVPLAGCVLVMAPGSMQIGKTDWAILSLAGFVTATPMLFFGAALRTLRLSTMGFLQYIGPTGQMLVALFVFHEPMDSTKLLSFAICWCAIAIYVVDSIFARAQAAPEALD